MLLIEKINVAKIKAAKKEREEVQRC